MVCSCNSALYSTHHVLINNTCWGQSAHTEKEWRERGETASAACQGEQVLADLSAQHFRHFATFFTQFCEWGLVAYERGGTIRQWHAQGVCRLQTTTGIMARNECRRFLGWDHSNPYGNLLHIMFKELKGTSICTPEAEGMVGYCVKDMNEYEGWEAFQHHMVREGTT